MVTKIVANTLLSFFFEVMRCVEGEDIGGGNNAELVSLAMIMCVSPEEGQ